MADVRDQLQAAIYGGDVIERELGGGDMSRVFVVEERRLGRSVAIKVLAPVLPAGINAERFQREIRLAASLQQANIVPVLVASESKRLPYFTMPFVEGRSLRARLGTGPLPVAEAIGILRDIARALDYAHAHGVVHCDIKPDNVLLSNGAAVVTDFGIAKALEGARMPTTGEGDPGTLTALGTTVGTPAYMAPEQAAGDPATDHRADLMPFGCVAHELLTGASPFGGRAPHELLVALHDPLAEMALAEKLPDDALREIRIGAAAQDRLIGCFACSDVRLGRVFDLANRPDSAIVWFDRFLAQGTCSASTRTMMACSSPARRTALASCTRRAAIARASRSIMRASSSSGRMRSPTCSPWWSRCGTASVGWMTPNGRRRGRRRHSCS